MADADKKMQFILKEMENKIMIRDYFRMKKKEWKVKSMLYSTIAVLIDNQKDVLELLQKMYIALKDVPAEELQKEFVTKLAEIIHNENNDKAE